MKKYNLDYLKELAAGDEAFMNEMIGYFIENTPKVIADLDLSLSETNWKNFRFAIHKFTPSLSMVGMTEMVPVASHLEHLSATETDTDTIPVIYAGFKENLEDALAELKNDFKLLAND
jgi:HPt (histidine-containing phosphotransfer) domain-containing protein